MDTGPRAATEFKLNAYQADGLRLAACRPMAAATGGIVEDSTPEFSAASRAPSLLTGWAF